MTTSIADTEQVGTIIDRLISADGLRLWHEYFGALEIDNRAGSASSYDTRQRILDALDALRADGWTHREMREIILNKEMLDLFFDLEGTNEF